ncbi:unnamed protein product [Linum trigynum]|uniref:Secreted protein n=1 Tax=Linum trigynum TaxID=586398 RepID=A0AAV2GB85_9ROSI
MRIFLALPVVCCMCRIMSLAHAYMQDLRLHPDFAGQYAKVINGVFHRHHHLEFDIFHQLHCMREIVAAISHPHWTVPLSASDSTYIELVWDFYSTFKYRCKASRHSTTSVTFRLGGQMREMSLDGLAHALGSITTHTPTTTRKFPIPPTRTRMSSTAASPALTSRGTSSRPARR